MIMNDNKMRTPRIEKLVLNIGCGTKLSIDVAKGLMERITGRKALITKSHTRSTFGVPKGKPLGVKVTIRNGAEEFLKRLLEAREGRLKRSCFDATGNVNFGVREYIDVSGVEYDPKIGMIGFDVCVTLERPGYRVKRKRIVHAIGKKHALTAEDAMQFMQSKFGVKLEE